MNVSSIIININGKDIECQKEETVLTAALKSGIYIPTLCYHPDLPSYGVCGLCVVELKGYKEPILACETGVRQGMKIITASPNLTKVRQEKLVQILTNHPHACLVCAEKEGCAREPCSLNVPISERCCEKLGNCELERVADYIGIPKDTPRYKPKDFPKYEDNPFIIRDYNLCIGCGRCVRVCESIRSVKALGELPELPERIDPSFFPENLKDAGCQFCNLCVNVCPTGTLVDRIAKIKDQAPCQEYCPAHINIPKFLRAIAENKFSTALSTLYQAVPFPGTLGYVCYYPCESECRRKHLDDAVSIRVLKRLAFEQTDNVKIKKFEKRSNKNIAVIGSGPAGLSCAFYLSIWGHNVTVFESKDRPGGMLRYGIPTYRLPRYVLEREIDIIKKTGMHIKTNTYISSVDEVLNKNFDAVFVGIGAQIGAKLGINGEDSSYVLDALQFLSETYGEITTNTDSILNNINKLGQRVAVIGGGNTAIDAARTALRLGAKVQLFYRRTETEMPAFHEEVMAAKEEGVEFYFLSVPVEIYPKKHKVKVEFIKMKLGPKDDSGRPRPIPINNCNFSLEFDKVITAIGQEVDLLDGIKADVKGWPEYNDSTINVKNGVYIGGDVVGPSSVVEAVAMGRKAAVQIHEFLGGFVMDTFPQQQRPKPVVLSQDIFLKKRMIIPTIEREKCLSKFSEIELSFDKETGLNEAGRCLQCDLCLYLSRLPMPPQDMLSFILENIKTVPENAGVCTLFDVDKRIIEIKGTANLKQMLIKKFGTSKKIKFFKYEEDPMYSKRESELLQQYVKQYGKIPSGDDELDDLF